MRRQPRQDRRLPLHRAVRGRAARGNGGGSERTVYVLLGSRSQPTQIKTGISDGVVTEVLEGLKEGDRVVTAELNAAASSSSPASNPFGGPRRFP
jgi:HlyD family secretion protein